MLKHDHWTDLKTFIEEWYRPLKPQDGLQAREIELAETRLGIRLPEALRELYLIAGAYLPCGHRWDRLADLHIAERPEPVLFIYRDEGSLDEYIVPLRLIGETDPPVVKSYCEEEQKSVGSVSEWAFYQIIKNTFHRKAVYNNSAYSMYCPPRVSLRGVRLLYSLGEYDDEFRAGDGVLIRTKDRQRWIQLLAKTVEKGEAFVCANRDHLIWKHKPDCIEREINDGGSANALSTKPV
ncbi:MAG: hypothetical protein SFU56_22215 [Capsulimonadales bacterium]|nr:hypothetical protein [Capsulimonadales bacterium]